ncbi:MAG: hypothetical protein ACD_17C00237G0001, partial [uncultured bacterium]
LTQVSSRLTIPLKQDPWASSEAALETCKCCIQKKEWLRAIVTAKSIQVDLYKRTAFFHLYQGYVVNGRPIPPLIKKEFQALTTPPPIASEPVSPEAQFDQEYIFQLLKSIKTP